MALALKGGRTTSSRVLCWSEVDIPLFWLQKSITTIKVLQEVVTRSYDLLVSNLGQGSVSCDHE